MIFQNIAVTFFVLILISVAYNDRLTKSFKLFLFLLLGSGIVFLFDPSLLDLVARYIGVSVGSDLVFYLTTMFVIYLAVAGYSKMLVTNRRIEKISRMIAIIHARVPVSKNDS